MLRFRSNLSKSALLLLAGCATAGVPEPRETFVSMGEEFIFTVEQGERLSHEPQAEVARLVRLHGYLRQHRLCPDVFEIVNRFESSPLPADQRALYRLTYVGRCVGIAI